jgi:(p)ppGpp synthase/HD superfamily hydrolase
MDNVQPGDMDTIHDAAKIAWIQHHGQTRAGGQPYIYHPMRVAGLVTLWGDDENDVLLTSDMIAAAWLHDVYEDTDFISPMLNCVNSTVERLVDELTNRFTKEAFPKLNRARRKTAEIARISDISPEAQIIKLCDRIDNLDTVKDKRGKKFHALYCDESQALAEAIPVGPFLHVQLYGILGRIRNLI